MLIFFYAHAASSFNFAFLFFVFSSHSLLCFFFPSLPRPIQLSFPVPFFFFLPCLSFPSLPYLLSHSWDFLVYPLFPSSISPFSLCSIPFVYFFSYSCLYLSLFLLSSLFSSPPSTVPFILLVTHLSYHSISHPYSLDFSISPYLLVLPSVPLSSFSPFHILPYLLPTSFTPHCGP